MKARFVNVWDYSRMGCVPFIVLQVEESDTFLINANFNPGYKFIIQALYKRVGAAGGHSFNPYYIENVKEKSQKIDTNEADVLGFYLGSISDIHDIPQNLYTEKFWGVVWSSHRLRESEYEGDEDYYKLLLTTGFSSTAMMLEQLDTVVNSIERNDSHEWMELTKKVNRDMREFYERMGADINKMHRRINYVIVDKENLSVIDDCWSTDNERTLANYLWLPFDVMPPDVFRDFANKHDDYNGLQILDINMYS